LPLATCAPSTCAVYSLSLHAALPILFVCAELVNAAAKCRDGIRARQLRMADGAVIAFPIVFYGQLPVALLDDRLFVCNLRVAERSAEHTSELQSRFELVCRLLLANKQ